jgi:hypothetical protein
MGKNCEKGVKYGLLLLCKKPNPPSTSMEKKKLGKCLTIENQVDLSSISMSAWKITMRDALSEIL